MNSYSILACDIYTGAEPAFLMGGGGVQDKKGTITLLKKSWINL